VTAGCTLGLRLPGGLTFGVRKPHTPSIGADGVRSEELGAGEVLGLRDGMGDGDLEQDKDRGKDVWHVPDNEPITSSGVEGGSGFSKGDGDFDRRRSCENCAVRPRLAKRSLSCCPSTISQPLTRRVHVDTLASDAMDTLGRCCNLRSNGQEATEKLSSVVSASEVFLSSGFWQLPWEPTALDSGRLFVKRNCDDILRFTLSCESRLNTFD
jgi:hypothetical protein